MACAAGALVDEHFGPLKVLSIFIGFRAGMVGARGTKLLELICWI
jgi:hypothetical protein